MQDECRGWDINDLVFTPALWGTYQHLMRSDFQLFDSYKFQHEGMLAGQVLERSWKCCLLALLSW